MSSAFDRIVAARAPASTSGTSGAEAGYSTFVPAANPLNPTAAPLHSYHEPAAGGASDRVLRETLLTAHAAQATATATAMELAAQGEQLRATHDKAKDVGDFTIRARALLRRAGHRALRSKLLLSAVIAAELAAIVAVVWLKYIRR